MTTRDESHAIDLDADKAAFRARTAHPTDDAERVKATEQREGDARH